MISLECINTLSTYGCKTDFTIHVRVVAYVFSYICLDYEMFYHKNLLELRPMKISRVLRSEGNRKFCRKKLQLVSHFVCQLWSATNSTYQSNLHQGTEVHFFLLYFEKISSKTLIYELINKKRRNIFVTYVKGLIIT